MPSEPAMAVSTAMRILSKELQLNSFISVKVIGSWVIGYGGLASRGFCLTRNSRKTRNFIADFFSRISLIITDFFVSHRLRRIHRSALALLVLATPPLFIEGVPQRGGGVPNEVRSRNTLQT